jgi:sulfate transport system permease protein
MKVSRSLQGTPIILVGLSGLLVFFLLLLPLGSILYEAFQAGGTVWFETFQDPETRHAIWLSLGIVLMVVPINVVFGMTAAWWITRFNPRGRSWLMALIDLPLSVSPVLAGMAFVLLLGPRTPVGSWLLEHGIPIIFSIPGMVLATLFVTLPLVVKELIPHMDVEGKEEETAAVLLGANSWITFYRITLPNIKWSLCFGILLCTARALGEFGAISVVSGRIRGQTQTVPLQIESLYNDYQMNAAFALASIFMVVAVLNTWIKRQLSQHTDQQDQKHTYINGGKA